MEIISPSEQLLFSTTLIETTTPNGRQSTGTGFIFTYNHSLGEIPFIVTNKHVINGSYRGKFTFTQAHDQKPNIGLRHSIIVDDFQNIWFGHPDDAIDVVVTPLKPVLEQVGKNNISLFYKSIPSSLIPSNEIIESFDALEDIIFVGYPNGIWDTKNLLPIMRRGITATPLSIDFQGQKQFLIDASVFPGSSGSPVFILNAGVYYNKKADTTVIGNRIYFLGIIASVFFKQDLNEIRMMPTPTVDVPMAISQQMINLGVVFKANTIMETIKAFLPTQGITL